MSWLSHYIKSLGAKTPPPAVEEAVNVTIIDRDTSDVLMTFETFPLEIRALPDGTLFCQPPLPPAMGCARHPDGKLYATVSVPPT